MSITMELTPFEIMATLTPREREAMLAYFDKQQQQLASQELIAKSLVDSSHTVEKSFKTMFKDLSLLETTLVEHGCKDIIIETENRLSCFMDNYVAVFFREKNDDVFEVKVACKENYGLAEKVYELSSEYTLHAQEASYLTIKEKINDKNYTIESEEVFEDNTIVLTIDIN